MQKSSSQNPVFSLQLARITESLNEEEKSMLDGLFKQSSNNDRQKLKSIKRVLDSPQETPIKSLIYEKLGPALLSEYLFGDLEAKPAIMNTIKNIKIDKADLLERRQNLHSFEQCKRMVEILENLCITKKLRDEQKCQISILSHHLYEKFTAELQKNTEMIAQNQFRTKWLEFFVEVLRCVNYMVKFIGRQGQGRKGFEKYDQVLYKCAKICIENCNLLSKETITQLFILVVFLDDGFQVPEANLQKIHYYHARNVINNENHLLTLLKMGFQLKDTEQKCQLIPILLKAFQQHYKGENVNKELKTNAFDLAITLFDVGRSIYSYLEEIIDIIILNQGNWNLEGSFTRKFFITRVALKYVPTKVIFELWPTVIEDCIVESGGMNIAYVTDCFEILLQKLYEENDNNYQNWISHWITAYKKALLSEDRTKVRGIIEFINPIVLKINSSNPGLLRELLTIKQGGLSIQLGLVSLIKCYKEQGKIVSWPQYMEIAKQKKIEISQEQEKVFIFIDDISFTFSYEFLTHLLLSNDSMISCKTLEFLTTSKKPSTLISAEEMDLILCFYGHCLKTSSPEYRKNYLNLTRRMLERFRRIYEKDVTGKNSRKVGGETIVKETEYFPDFIKFLNKIINLCYENVYPDSIFEITDPALEILLLIVTLFGPEQSDIRKRTTIKPCMILLEKTQFFKISHFYNLVNCLQSAYESIRQISHTIINKFKNVVIKDERDNLRRIWKQSIENTNKLSIKSYQFACRLLTFIGNLDCDDIIGDLPKKYTFRKLNICQYFLNLMQKRYSVFKEQFVDQGEIYYSNLLHGVLTCFSYILDEIIPLAATLNKDELSQLKEFLTQFFSEMVKILAYSVEVSSANISTVVLDTLASLPSLGQAEKKLKVDCRGHFLPEKKHTVGTYLDSTALISSMENEEEGIENTLVVSFYLLTREAGLVFQSIGGLVGTPNSSHFIPKKELVTLVNTYFYALINLKHMGSVDRISIGLQKMAKVIFDHEDKELSQIPERLLNSLVELLTDGKFTNILRRSAGVPYAFSCLLKSQALKRKMMIEQTVRTLLKLSEENKEQSMEVRIHALNILKKLFQDSDLKQDLDSHVSMAFISSIRGFTSEEWGVRNSSLMLFSVLANRTLGVKPTLNLLQFFHKCPELHQFISDELSLSENKKHTATHTMYPPLYPIVLLLSRLLPFDLKQKARMTIKGQTIKQVRKQELLNMGPLLRAAGDNHNYMGRVMTAKAILPFMELNNIIPHCLNLLREYQANLKNIKNNKISNNAEHYRLTQCYHLLNSYHSITDSKSYAGMGEISSQIKEEALEILQGGAQWLCWEKSGICPTVHEIYLKIYAELLARYFKDCRLYELVVENCENSLRKFIEKGCRVIGDLGHSLMYKSCIQLLAQSYKHLLAQNKDPQCLAFIQYLKVLQKIPIQSFDNEILCLLLHKIQQITSNTTTDKHPLKQSLLQWIHSLQILKISNDDVLIRVLHFLQADSSIDHKFITDLMSVEERSENKKLKVAIFQYLLALYREGEGEGEDEAALRTKVHGLANEYANPEQLGDLRECCIDLLHKSTRLYDDCLLMYIRMLEDEEAELRKLASLRLSEILQIPPQNEEILKTLILKKIISSHLQDKPFLLKTLQTFMKDNSDYHIRRKNHNEERIFSYDKPNKYRTDINTLVEIIDILPMDCIKMLREEAGGLWDEGIEWESMIENYRVQVMERNEYQFETIVRGLILRGKGSGGNVTDLHPLFEKVFMKSNL